MREVKTDDDVWIPVVAAQGWVVITKDSAIGGTLRLRQLANDHGARLLAIAARERMRKWDQLVVVSANWSCFDALVDVPGPWMYRVSRSGLTRVAGVGEAGGQPT